MPLGALLLKSNGLQMLSTNPNPYPMGILTLPEPVLLCLVFWELMEGRETVPSRLYQLYLAYALEMEEGNGHYLGQF